MFMALPTQTPARCFAGAGGGIRTPDRLITNQLLYRTELRQPDKNGSVARPVPRGQARVDTNSFRRRTARLRGWMPPLSSKIGAVSSEMSPRLRVLHAIHDFLPRHQAGSELYAAALGAALQRRGHHVTVLAAEYDPARPHGDLAWRAHDGLPVVEVVNNWTYPNAAIAWSAPDLMRAFEHVLEATDPDVLHVHSLLNLSLDLPALARRRGIPVVATLHDYTLVCPSGGQRIHKAENHICHTIEPERCARCFSESPFFSQMAYGRVLRAPIGARSFSLARQLARAAPGLASRLARTVGTGSGAAVTPAAITARLDRARTAFDAFDLVVAPSAALAAEFQQLGFP